MEREKPGTTEAPESTETASTTRRAMLLGGVAGLAGITASLVVGAEPAGAANGNPVELGESNAATATTSVTTTGGYGLAGSTSDNAFSGVYGEDTSTGGGFGLYAQSTNGTGAHGTTAADGQSGVTGADTSAGGGHGVFGKSTNGTGVLGQTGGDGESGVYGSDTSTGGGFGLYGESTGGTGVYGASTNGWRLRHQFDGPRGRLRWVDQRHWRLRHQGDRGSRYQSDPRRSQRF